MLTVNDLKKMNINSFTFFFREYKKKGEFSQWYIRDFDVDGMTFCCMEQYMMYKKAILFNDYEIANKIMNSRNPEYIKHLGREVDGFDKEIWDKHKIEIVSKGNYMKFSQNKDLKDKLLNTKGLIAEASPYDKIWGIGLRENNPNSRNMHMWRGENLLGIILTYLRIALQKEKSYDEFIKFYEDTNEEELKASELFTKIEKNK